MGIAWAKWQSRQRSVRSGLVGSRLVGAAIVIGVVVVGRSMLRRALVSQLVVSLVPIVCVVMRWWSVVVRLVGVGTHRGNESLLLT